MKLSDNLADDTYYHLHKWGNNNDENHPAVLTDFGTAFKYLNAQNWHIEPKNGLLIMFPSHVHHKISTNLSNEDRYSLAFDITKL